MASAPDKCLYEYSVIRYVPRVDREEFINIGLLMMCKRRKWLKGRVELNLGRLMAFDPKVNLESLERQCHIFEKTDIPGKELPVEEKYRWLSAVKSAMLQTSPSHPGMVCGEDEEEENVMEREFSRLFDEIVRI